MIPTGIDRSINPEQLGALAVRSAFTRAAIRGVSWAGTVTRGHVWAHRPRCWCSASACMVLPCWLCVAYINSVATVGGTAERERSERSTHALS